MSCYDTASWHKLGVGGDTCYKVCEELTLNCVLGGGGGVKEKLPQHPLPI